MTEPCLLQQAAAAVVADVRREMRTEEYPPLVMMVRNPVPVQPRAAEVRMATEVREEHSMRMAAVI